MDYVIREHFDRTGNHLVEVARVPEGQWVAKITLTGCTADTNWRGPPSPKDRDPEVIGADRKKMNHFELRGGYNCPNAGGGYTWSRELLIASHQPFAVVRSLFVGPTHYRAKIEPSRQIHKGELGRDAPLNVLPAVTRSEDMWEGAKRTTAWVEWSEIAKMYGESDLRKLWNMFMPFVSPSEHYVTSGGFSYLPVRYADTGGHGRVFYRPTSNYGLRLKHWLDVPFDGSEYDAKRARMPQHAAKITEFETRRREDHEERLIKVRARQRIPDVLHDDPVLALEHLCVPVSFAKSILYCKQFGYIPDFSKDMEAQAGYWAEPAS